MGNDTDADGNPLTAILVSGPSSGTLNLNSNGSFTYSPAVNFNGSVTFTYKANDGLADSNVATVTITVNGVNDPPLAANDSLSTVENTPIFAPAPGVLGNDSDVDSTTLTAVLVSGPSNGTLSLNPNGSFTYTPFANFTGTDSFTYKANDGLADSNVATVTVAVTPASSGDVTPPTLVSFSFSPTTIDTSSGAATVTVTVQAVDSQSGVCIGSTLPGPCPGPTLSLVEFRHVGTSQFVAAGFNLVAGTLNNGTFQAELGFPQGSASGTWKISPLLLADQSGNVQVFSEADLAARGFPTELLSTAVVEDQTPPALVAFSFTPTTIDTTVGPATVTVTMQATDSGSGVCVLPTCLTGFPMFVEFENAGSTQSQEANFALVSGTLNDGTFEAQVILPQGSAAGTWKAIVGLRDQVRNFQDLLEADLTARGFSTELIVTPPGMWASTGSMAAARWGHTATLLTNGKVLIFGGTPGPSPELYDPATGTFSSAGAPSVSRGTQGGITATRLLDGRVLIVGGNEGSTTPQVVAEIFDPQTGTFASTGSLNVGRTSHTATLLRDGRVLIAGGQIVPSGESHLAAAELYDPVTGMFTLTGSLNVGRFSHSATRLQDGRVLIASGEQITTPGFAISLNSAEIYNPATGTFTPTGNMAVARCCLFWAQAPLLNNGKVLIVGGFSTQSAELYDPATGTFSATGNMTVSRGVPSATLLPNGQVLVAGGFGSTTTNSAELYDPATGTFTRTGNMNQARQQNTATLLLSGQVLVTGGAVLNESFTGSTNLSSADLYKSLDSDGDGIPNVVDRNKTTGADERITISSDYSDSDLGGLTSGTITDRGGWMVGMEDLQPGGVRVNITGAGTIAHFDSCDLGSTERVSLDMAGEVADITCNGLGSTTVTAVLANPFIEVRDPPTGEPATLVTLSSGQTVTIGSPITASSSNTQPVLVELVDANNLPIGSFSLDPSESASVTFDALGTTDVTVLSGTATVTVGTQTATLSTGETQTALIVPPDTLLTNMSQKVSEFLASGDIANAGIAQSLTASLKNATRLVGVNNTAVKGILEALINKLNAFLHGGQITPPVREAFVSKIHALVSSLP